MFAMQINRVIASNVLLQELRTLVIYKTVFVLFKKTFVALLLKTPFILLQSKIENSLDNTANVTIDLLVTKFGQRVISRKGSVGWPPRSCDLTPLDNFLCDYAKSMVYANKPAAIDELRTNIEREIAAVSADLSFKSVWTSASVPVVAMQIVSHS